MSSRLRVNPIMCKAHGLCAELVPELIELDPWGYPIVSDESVPDDLEILVGKAVAACPTLALLVEADRRQRTARHHRDGIGRQAGLDHSS